MTTRFIPAPGDAARPAGESGLEYFRNALNEQRQFRMEQLRELDAASNAAHLTDPSRNEVLAALRTAARRALAEVDAALGRMALDEYGICQGCGGDITLARLEIVPMAALCMSCQRLTETGPPGADTGRT
ncbi:MAG TPA: TraR/DksA C4-type zinc finger protein [Jatrophihabitans sp.]|nr:TraR/DksA C4-type zinc finger protein [Jatrophihabitans sp.]